MKTKVRSHTSNVLIRSHLTYRLHEYFGFTPNFAHASFSGVPSGISILLLPDVSTVICKLLSVLLLIQQLLLDGLVGTATNA